MTTSKLCLIAFLGMLIGMCLGTQAGYLTGKQSVKLHIDDLETGRRSVMDCVRPGKVHVMKESTVENNVIHIDASDFSRPTMVKIYDKHEGEPDTNIEINCY